MVSDQILCMGIVLQSKLYDHNEENLSRIILSIGMSFKIGFVYYVWYAVVSKRCHSQQLITPSVVPRRVLTMSTSFHAEYTARPNEYIYFKRQESSS